MLKEVLQRGIEKITIMQPQKMIDGYPYIAYKESGYEEDVMVSRSGTYSEWMDRRRTVRAFSDRPVPRIAIENIIKAASTAPSGAHKQPWTFCVVHNPVIKQQIREAAEKEEYESYNNRMPDTWLNDLKPLGTDWHKPFLETAPYLIIVFKKVYEPMEDGTKKNNYYVQESVGLACGFLLTAIHHAGLVALTHTPSPMNFLTHILGRPDHEKPFLLIPVGYAAEECWVPDIQRKKLEEVMVYY
jgi:iodotyrosine deiodinase